MAVADSQIAEIKAKLDILGVVQSYVPSLKSKGRNHFGLCPFHNEKSPSFSVNPELGIFKCFGCGEGGDVITFLEKIEGLEFSEALKLAAEKAGVELRQARPVDDEFKRKQERAFHAHSLAANYYHYLLTEHKGGKEGLYYATEKRGLRLQEIKKYQLGFAPSGYHNLESYLLKKGYSRGELVDFGLLVNQNGRIYDKFRGRLMHPIFDLRGRVIGFSGRIIAKDSQAPKYLNSPETVIYEKKRNLYGLIQARDAIRSVRKVIVVEGNLDVIASVAVGVEYIVCPLGTALTTEQLQLLKRYAGEILFALDRDAAGEKALLRSLELAERLGLQAKAIDLGNYKDVDELVDATKAKEPGTWGHLVTTALDVPSFIMENFRHNYDLRSPAAREQYVQLCLNYLAKVESKIKLDQYLQRLATLSGTSLELLVELVGQVRQEQKLNQTGLGGFKKPASPSKAGTEAELAAETVEKPLPKFQRNLITLANRLLAVRDNIENPAELREIYVKHLSLREVGLLDGLLGLPLGTNVTQVELNELAARAAEVKRNFTPSAPQTTAEVKEMLIDYVKRRITSYLRVLHTQLASNTEPETAAQEGAILQRIKTYAKVKAELDRS